MTTASQRLAQNFRRVRTSQSDLKFPHEKGIEKAVPRKGRQELNGQIRSRKEAPRTETRNNSK